MNFISKLLKYSLSGNLNMTFLRIGYLGNFLRDNFKTVDFDQSCRVLIVVCKYFDSFMKCTTCP